MTTSRLEIISIDDFQELEKVINDHFSGQTVKLDVAKLLLCDFFYLYDSTHT